MTQARIKTSRGIRRPVTLVCRGTLHRAHRLLRRTLGGIRGSRRPLVALLLVAILECVRNRATAPGSIRAPPLTRGRIGRARIPRHLTLGHIVSLPRLHHRHSLTLVRTGRLDRRLIRLRNESLRWVRHPHTSPPSKFVRPFYLMVVGRGLLISCRRLPARWVDPTRPRLRRRRRLRRVTKC